MKKILITIAILALLFIAGCGNNTVEKCDDCKSQGYFAPDEIDRVCIASGYVYKDDVNKLIDITNTLIEGTNQYFNSSIDYVIHYE